MISIEIKPLRGSSKRAQQQIRKLAARIKNPTAANRDVSIRILRWVNDNFKSEGGKVGKWKPFKLGGRRLPNGSIDTSAKLLQDTGRLKASFSNFWSRETAGVGSPLNYSLEHDLGLPMRNLPARRMLPGEYDRELESNIIKIYEWHIEKALR